MTWEVREAEGAEEGLGRLMGHGRLMESLWASGCLEACVYVLGEVPDSARYALDFGLQLGDARSCVCRHVRKEIYSARFLRTYSMYMVPRVHHDGKRGCDVARHGAARRFIPGLARLRGVHDQH